MCQGDPISSTLFVIFMEAFSKMVVKGGYTVNGSENNSLKVSYLLFMDDTLIICGTNSNTIMHLRYVLTAFLSVSLVH